MENYGKYGKNYGKYGKKYGKLIFHKKNGKLWKIFDFP
jgi:hypothetical protein